MRNIILALLMVSSFPAGAGEASCNTLRENLKTADNLLNSASLANNFNDAKRAMDKSKSAVNAVAADARACPCVEAANQFEKAATKFRRAGIAASVGEYNKYTRQGVKEYGAAINGLNNCPASQQTEQTPAE